jgi:hypothetical protein
MFNFFRKSYEYARLINNDDNKFILITEDKDLEFGNIQLEKAMNKAGSKGWQFIEHDHTLGLIFKKVK